MGHGYRLVKKLGEGAVGEVFEAEHCSLGHAVAVKVLHTHLLSRARTRQRFQSEARALARIDSEYVVRVLDYGTLDDGRPFTVMELLKGVDMRALLAYEHRVSIARGVRLVQDACRGLAAAHAAGFIHRDLKPENLFVARRPDGSERCKVIDFGVAREVNASPVTAEGTLVGTTRYMTPEQVRGQRSRFAWTSTPWAPFHSSCSWARRWCRGRTRTSFCFAFAMSPRLSLNRSRTTIHALQTCQSAPTPSQKLQKEHCYSIG